MEVEVAGKEWLVAGGVIGEVFSVQFSVCSDEGRKVGRWGGGAA
jgi:hypothetical protein